MITNKGDMASWEDFIGIIMRGIIPFITGFSSWTKVIYFIQFIPSNDIGFLLAVSAASIYAIIFGISNMSKYLIKAVATVTEIPTVKLWLWVQKEKIRKKNSENQ